jgi:hypothetical protein
LQRGLAGATGDGGNSQLYSGDLVHVHKVPTIHTAPLATPKDAFLGDIALRSGGSGTKFVSVCGTILKVAQKLGVSVTFSDLAAAAALTPAEADAPEVVAAIAAMAGTLVVSTYIGACLTDFRSSKSASDAQTLAAEKRLSIHWNTTIEPGATWRVTNQDPPPGAPVSPGATVTISDVCPVHVYPSPFPYRPGPVRH